MSLGNFVKRIQNITRQDAGVNGDAQRIEQLTWMLFLKIYDDMESDWEIEESNYESIIPKKFRWRNWADTNNPKGMKGDDLLDFVNNKLFPALQKLQVPFDAPLKKGIVKSAFADIHNYMKNGVLLREVMSVINECDFNDPEESHAFGTIYESILRDLQSAGNAGEFYTPRALTDFMAQHVNLKIGDTVADFACGTGGFLNSARKFLEPKIKTTADREKVNHAFYGVEKKPLPYLLAVTNILLNKIDNPNIHNGNSLSSDVSNYTVKDQFDVILMNPPYGGSEIDTIQQNFPGNMRSAETADLFMILIMARLKKNGRAAVVLPDGFLFGTGNKVQIKERLLTRFNLHTIVRLPPSVFSPYTSIATNILFFDNTAPTKETWFYRVDKPEGYKHFSKTKPMLLEHLADLDKWWKNRKEIMVDNVVKATSYTAQEIADGGYNLDLCGFPHKEEEVLPPHELIAKYKAEREISQKKVDDALKKILALLPEKN